MKLKLPETLEDSDNLAGPAQVLSVTLLCNFLYSITFSCLGITMSLFTSSSGRCCFLPPVLPVSLLCLIILVFSTLLLQKHLSQPSGTGLAASSALSQNTLYLIGNSICKFIYVFPPGLQAPEEQGPCLFLSYLAHSRCSANAC